MNRREVIVRAGAIGATTAAPKPEASKCAAYEWDTFENKDFHCECVLGFFRNHDPADESSFGEVFGMLTAVKSLLAATNGCRYEEHWSRRWRHFRPATAEEVALRTHATQLGGRR